MQPCLPITGTFYNNKTFAAVHRRETAYYETLTDKCGKFLCFNSACFFGITCQLTIVLSENAHSPYITAFCFVSSQLLMRFTILVRSSLISRKCSSSCVILILEKYEDRTEMTKIINYFTTNLACSSHTAEYWSSVVYVWTSLGSVQTATHSPVQHSRSVTE